MSQKHHKKHHKNHKKHKTSYDEGVLKAQEQGMMQSINKNPNKVDIEKQEQAQTALSFSNLFGWKEFFSNIFVNMYHYESPVINHHNLRTIERIILRRGFVAVIQPAIIDRDWTRYTPNRLIIRECAITRSNNVTGEITAITVTNNNQDGFTRKVSYDKLLGDKFAIICGLPVATNNEFNPFLQYVRDYAFKMFESDRALQQTFERLKQPIVAVSAQKGNFAPFYNDTISNLGSVVGLVQDDIPENGKLFHDINRDNQIDTIFDFQKGVMNDFGKLLGFTTIDNGAGTYQAEEIQKKDLSLDNFIAHMHAYNRSWGIKDVNDTFGYMVDDGQVINFKTNN